MEEKKKILVVSDRAGAGARDHALVAKYAESSFIFWSSPNAAVRYMGNVVAVDITADSIEEYITGLVGFAKRYSIDLTMVASEEWLFAGIVDRFEAEGLPIIGPSRKAAFFTEGSKDLCKQILGAHGIRTAPYFASSNRGNIRAYLETYMASPGSSCVIKADGPARGKGVGIAESFEDALFEVERIWALNPGDPILIEKRLRGREVSYIIAVDGAGNTVPLVPVRDYKELFSGGPMTGGIGAHTVELSKALRNKIDDLVARTINALREEGIPYKGFLYFGLMIVEEDGEEVPYILELNCRLGDPEAQVILSCMKSNLAEFCIALWEDRLDTVILEWSDEEFVAIVLASQGYPGSAQMGEVVYNLEQAEQNAHVYYGGLRRNDDGELVTAGGRVLTVVCSGACTITPLIVEPERRKIALKKAREKAYAVARLISFGDPDPRNGTQVFREDIALGA